MNYKSLLTKITNSLTYDVVPGDLRRDWLNKLYSMTNGKYINDLKNILDLNISFTVHKFYLRIFVTFAVCMVFTILHVL